MPATTFIGLNKNKGTWNAETNTATSGSSTYSPALVNGAYGDSTLGGGTTTPAIGDFFVIDTTGDTTVDSVTSWTANDVVVFASGSGGNTWTRLDYTSTVSAVVVGGTNKAILSNDLLGGADLDNTELAFVSGSKAAGTTTFKGSDTLVYNYANGNLGVGTASPGSRLHVATGENKIATLENTQSGGDAYLLYRTSYGTDVNWSTGIKTSDDSFRIASGSAIGSNDCLIIDSSGKVGIGTATPASKLDVEGSVAVGATYSGTTAAPSNGMIVEGRVGIGLSSPSETLHVDGNVLLTDGDYLATDKVRAIDGDGLQLQDDGGNGVSIIDGGNVGVGVTDPDTKLEVFSTTTQLKLSYNGTNYATLAVASDGQLDITTVDASAAAGHICFMPDGNVGIGTTSPSELLHLKSATASKPVLLIENTNDDANPGQIKFYKSTTDSEASGDDIGEITFTAADAANNDTNYAWVMGESFDNTSGGEEGALHFGVVAVTNSTTALSLVGQASSLTSYAIFGDPWQGSTSSRIGVHTSAPAKMLDINAKGSADGIQLTWNDNDGSATDYATITIEDTNGLLKLTTVDSDGASGHIALMPDGNVGIGTTSPETSLHIQGGSAGTIATVSGALLTLESNEKPRIHFQSPGGYGGSIVFGSPTDNDEGQIDYDHGSDRFLFKTGGNTKMAILGDNVGIGTSSPSQKLHVDGNILQTTGDYLATDKVRAIDGDGLYLVDDGDNGIFVKDGGNVGIGTASPGRPLHIETTENEVIRLDNTANGGNCVINYRASYGTDVNWAAGIKNSDDSFCISNSTNAGTNDRLVISGDNVFDFKSDGTTPSELRLYCESSNAHYVGIRGPLHSSAETYILKIPNTPPSDNEILKVSGTPSGTPKVVTLAWEADSGEGSGISFDGSTANGVLTYKDSDEATVESNLTFDGSDLTVSGNATATSFITSSSLRLKKNIEAISCPIEKAKMLRGVMFDWKETGKKSMGFIAEEVGEVVPEVVNYEENGIDATGINYGNLTALLIECVKKQNDRIDALQKEINILKS